MSQDVRKLRCRITKVPLYIYYVYLLTDIYDRNKYKPLKSDVTINVLLSPPLFLLTPPPSPLFLLTPSPSLHLFIYTCTYVYLLTDIYVYDRNKYKPLNSDVTINVLLLYYSIHFLQCR